ncbi:Ribosome biogenesis ATPase RIX7 [Balamuthia mandrillaris]
MPRRRTQYPPYSTDPKLIPRIVDWMTVQQVPLHRANLTPAAFNTETLVEYLRTTFAPYRRKPLPAFRLVIERALPRAFEIRQLQAAAAANSNNSGGRNLRDRRRRDDEEEESEEPSSSSVSDSSLDDEDDSDSEEFELDPGVRMMEVKDNNMLNSSLRNTYRTNSTAENNRLLILRRQQQRQQQKAEQQQEGTSSTAKSNTSNQNGSSEDTTPSSLSPPIDPSFSSPQSSGSSYSHEDNPSSSSFASSSSSSSSSTSFHHSSTVSTPFSSSGSSSSSVAPHSSIPLASSALSSCSSTTTTTVIPSALSSLRESADELVVNGENGTSNNSNSIQVMEEEESEGGDTSEPNSTDSLRRQKKRQRSSVPETSLTASQTPANKTDANKQQPKQSQSQTPNKTHPQSKRRKRVLKQSSSQAKNIHFTNSTAVEDLVSGTNDENGDLSPSFSAPSIPTARYSDLGGIDECLQEVRELIEWPLLRPEIYSHLGVKPSTGVLLYGPPGCGKTLLANAIAGELEVPFFRVSAPEIVTGMSGQSESRIRRLFADAIAAAPAIIFIDEIDAITPKRETAEKEMTRRIVAQFLTCMDDLSNRPLDDPPVIIIGATNRPDSLDSALRRNGRFAREIGLGVPDEAARARILSVLSKQLRLAGDFNFREIAHKTPGFVGADLSALTREAATLAVHRVFHQLLRQPPQQQDSAATSPPTSEQVQNTNEEKEKEKENEMGTVESEQMMDVETQTLTSTLTTATSLTMSDDRELQARIELSDRLRLQQARLSPEELSSLAITMQDFEAAIKKVQPSAKREGFATIPDVTWDDVGALEEMRTELRLSILEPIRRPLTYGRMGISSKTGILLYGPPGCGKTLLAKAMANEGGFNFISVKGPELLNKYVGESEKAVREVFSRGSASSPCIIFFDEVDALCPRRDGGDGASSNSTQRVVNQLLTEMDGLTQRGNVAIIAATNRPDIIDSAILRPGRLDKLVYVPLPTPSERARILQTLTRKIPCHPSLDLPSIASHTRCNRFSGADLSALVREAALMAVQQTLAVRPEMKDWEEEPELLCLRNEHFEGAFMKVVPSVSEREERLYNNMQRKLKAKQEAAASAASSSIAPTLPITEADSQSGPSSSSSNT